MSLNSRSCACAHVQYLPPCRLLWRRRGPEVSRCCWQTWLLRLGRWSVRWEAKVQISPPASPSTLASRPAELWVLNTTQKHNLSNACSDTWFFILNKKKLLIVLLYCCITYVAVWLVSVSSYCHCAAFQHGHYSLEVALVDDASVVRAGLWVVCVEVLSEQTISECTNETTFCWVLKHRSFL